MFVFLVKTSCVFTNFDKQKTNFDLFWRLQAVKFHWILIDHLGFQCCVFTDFFLSTNSDQSIGDIKTTENSSNLTIYYGSCCAFPDFCSWHYWQLSKFSRYFSFSVFFLDFAKAKPSRILQVFSSLSKMASLSLVELWSPKLFWLQKRPCHIWLWLSNEKKTHQISMFTYDVVISLNFVPHWNPMLTFDNIDKLSKIRQIFPPVFFQFWQISTDMYKTQPIYLFNFDSSKKP